MPSGSRGSPGSPAMAMTDMTQWTEEELQKEFSRTGDTTVLEGEGDVDVERREGGSSRTPSTDQHSSSSGSLTPSTSIPSLSDGATFEDQEKGDRAMEDSEQKEERKRKNSAQVLWKTVKKAGTEINHDTRRAFRFIGQKLRSSHEPRQTKVKEVHILPGEEYDGMWARRMAGRAHSGSSSGSDPST